MNEKHGFLKDAFLSMEDIPREYQIGPEITQRQYLSGGKIKTWEGPLQDVYSPIHIREGENSHPFKLGSYPLMTAQESLAVLEEAVQAYDKGRGLWPTLSVEKRIQHIELFIEKMLEKRDEVIRLLMWEIGKNRSASEKEFDRTVDYIKDTIEALKDLDRQSSRFTIEQGILAQIRRAPLGVVLCMGPYNYPLNETYTTLIPALIMGNVVVFKAPKLGVLLHSPLLQAFQEAFPPGVVNTIYGEGQTIVGPVMESGKVDVLAFIGSSKVADILKQQHPLPHRLKSVLGLGAKNAGIFLKDCDLDSAVKEAVLGSLSYNGQRCTALKILFVHKDIAQEFSRRFSEKVSALKAGMPWEEGVEITPLPVPQKSEYLDGLIQDAKKHGADVINENGGIFEKTLFFPAVLYPVNHKMRIYNEEQFGPLVPIVPFSDIQEAIDYVINSHYGQQVSLFGNDAVLMSRLIDPLVNQVCRVNINSQCQRGPDVFPFSGRKDSAEGTLSVSDALRVFAIRTLVSAKMTDQNKKLIKEILKEDHSNFLSTDFIL